MEGFLSNCVCFYFWTPHSGYIWMFSAGRDLIFCRRLPLTHMQTLSVTHIQQHTRRVHVILQPRTLRSSVWTGWRRRGWGMEGLVRGHYESWDAERHEQRRLSSMSQACCITGGGEGIGDGRVSLLAPPWHDTNPDKERGGREECNRSGGSKWVYLLKSNASKLLTGSCSDQLYLKS